MPAYNFKKQFANVIESGTKRQTIRPRRKYPTKPGDILYLYTGMRTKQCRKLGEYICRGVESVEIHPDHIKVSGEVLEISEAEELAQHDGFENLDHFYDFFEEHYGVPHDIDLVLIRW